MSRSSVGRHTPDARAATSERKSLRVARAAARSAGLSRSGPPSCSYAPVGSIRAARSAASKRDSSTRRSAPASRGRRGASRPDFDAATRFAIAWYRQHGYATGKFGVADDLARARKTAVETLVRDGILTSAAGKVTLLAPANMPEGYDVLSDERVGTWEVLHHLIAFLERDGLPVAGAFLASARERPDGAIDPELVKELAFLLFSIAEKNGRTQDALAFNTVATAWPDIVQAARSVQTGNGEQAAFEFEED